MDLWCTEPTASPALSFDSGVFNDPEDLVREECLPASIDHKLLNNGKVLERLLQTEAHYIPPPVLQVYKCVQKEVQLHMRKTLATWMCEVS